MARTLRHRSMLVGGLILVLVAAAALLAPVLAPGDPTAMNLDRKLLPPGEGAPAGTDNFGRDVLTRLLYGARISLGVSLLAVAVGSVCGGIVGLVSGYYGGWVDLIIQRIVDVMMAFPGLLLALAIVAVVGPGITNVMLAVGISLIPTYVRLVRGQVLAVKEREFVEAARAVGVPVWMVLARHVTPNILSPVLVVSTLSLGGAILATAALSYLGLGAQPPQASWGTMLAEGQRYVRTAWWLPTFPGLAITLTVLGFNLMGDGLRDLLDPTHRRQAG